MTVQELVSVTYFLKSVDILKTVTAHTNTPCKAKKASHTLHRNGAKSCHFSLLSPCVKKKQKSSLRLSTTSLQCLTKRTLCSLLTAVYGCKVDLFKLLSFHTIIWAEIHGFHCAVWLVCKLKCCFENTNESIYSLSVAISQNVTPAVTSPSKYLRGLSGVFSLFMWFLLFF